MPASETLELLIKARDEAGRSIDVLNKQLTRTQRTVARTQKAFRGFRRGVAGLRRSVLGLRTAFLGLGIGLLARNLIQASNQQAEAVKGLEAALRSMGRFTPTLRDNLLDVASALQGMTNFGDEATIEGQKFLITYSAITDDLLPRTTRAMVDLAALTGKDMVAASNLLGKAALGYTSELQRSGITVDKNAFKMKGFLGVLEQIELQVAGQAVAQREATGSLVALGNVIGDVRESMGDLLKLALEPIASVLLDLFNKLTKRIKALQAEGQLHIWAEKWANAIIDGIEAGVKAVAVMVKAIHGIRLIFASVKTTFTGLVAEMLRGARDVNEKWQTSLRGILDTTKKVLGVVKFLPGAAGAFASALQKSIPIAVKALDSLKENEKAIDDGAQAWTKVHVESLAHLEVLEKQKDPYKVITEAAQVQIDKARELTKELGNVEKALKDAADAATPPPPPTASFAAQTASIVARDKELNSTLLTQLKQSLDNGKTTTEDFFKEKERLRRADFDAEQAAIGKSVLVEKDPTKKLQLQDRLFKSTQKFARDEIALEQEKNDAIKAMEEKRADTATFFRDLRARAAPEDEGLQAKFDREREGLLAQQATEIESLRGHEDEKNLVHQAGILHRQELEKQDAAHRMALQQQVTDNVKKALGGFEQAFGDLYEATGKKVKIFFKLQKAAGIANTIIATYEGATQAYKSAAQIPIIGHILAPIAAAAAVAAGLAKVAVIRGQQIAAGGPVLGTSPTTTSDNIPAWLTAGEFVHPVDTVRHYGARAMEAIKNRVVPRDLLQGFAGGGMPKPNYSYAFQTGGGVPSRQQLNEPADTGGGRGMVIANFYDPEELTRFLATARGQDAVINAIAGRRETVRRVIQ